MASRTLPGLGLKGDWALGENNWKDEMDLNLLMLSVFTFGIVASRLSATPGAPAEGDRHIFKADHPTQANKIAVYDEATWKYLTPPERTRLYSTADKQRFEYTAAGGWLPIPNDFRVQAAKVAAYAAVLGDQDTLIPINTAGNVAFTIPVDVFVVGTRLYIEQRGAGKVVFTAGAGGVTINATGATYTTANQYALAQAVQTQLNVWTLTGDLIV